MRKNGKRFQVDIVEGSTVVLEHSESMSQQKKRM